MYIELFRAPIDPTYAHIYDLGSRAAYLAFLRTNYRIGNAPIALNNTAILAPQIRLTLTPTALDASYAFVGNELDGNDIGENGDFYFIRSADVVSLTACNVLLVSDLYHNYIKRDIAPAYVTTGLTTRGHLAFDYPNDFGPYDLPLALAPTCGDINVHTVLAYTHGYEKYRVIVTANVDGKPTYRGMLPEKFMTAITKNSLTRNAALHFIGELSNVHKWSARATWADATEGYTPFNIINFTALYIVPDVFCPDITTDHVDIKVVETANEPVMAQPVYSSLTLVPQAFPNVTWTYTLPNTAIDAGTIVQVGTMGHRFTCAKTGQDHKFTVRTTYTNIDGYRFTLEHGGDVCDITPDFAGTYLNAQNNAYWAEAQNQTAATNGIMGAVSAMASLMAGGPVGGAILTAGTVAVSSAIGRIGAEFSQARKPFDKSENVNGILNAIYGGFSKFVSTASNYKAELAMIDTYGVDYAHKYDNEALYIPNTSRGYVYIAFEDINLAIGAPADIREQCNQIFRSGTTIHNVAPTVVSE